jgi:hypothetical protein
VRERAVPEMSLGLGRVGHEGDRFLSCLLFISRDVKSWECGNGKTEEDDTRAFT